MCKRWTARLVRCFWLSVWSTSPPARLACPSLPFLCVTTATAANYRSVSKQNGRHAQCGVGPAKMASAQTSYVRLAHNEGRSWEDLCYACARVADWGEGGRLAKYRSERSHVMRGRGQGLAVGSGRDFTFLARSQCLKLFYFYSFKRSYLFVCF